MDKDLVTALKDFYTHYDPKNVPEKAKLEEFAKGSVGKERQLWDNLYGHFAPGKPVSEDLHSQLATLKNPFATEKKNGTPSENSAPISGVLAKTVSPVTPQTETVNVADIPVGNPPAPGIDITEPKPEVKTAPQINGLGQSTMTQKVSEPGTVDTEATIKKQSQEVRASNILETSKALDRLAVDHKMDPTPWKREIEGILTDKNRPQEVNDVLALRAAYSKFQDLGVTRHSNLPGIGVVTSAVNAIGSGNGGEEMAKTWELLSRAEQQLRNDNPTEWNKLIEKDREKHYGKLYAQDPRYTTKGDALLPGISVGEKQLIASAIDNGWTGLSSDTDLVGPNQEEIDAERARMNSEIGSGPLQELVLAHQTGAMKSNTSEVAEAKLRNELAHGQQKIAALKESGASPEVLAQANQAYSEIKMQADAMRAERHKELLQQIDQAKAALDRTDLPKMARAAGMQLLKSLEEKDRGFIDPTYEFDKVMKENIDDIATASKPTDTPEQAMRKYLANMIYEKKMLDERIGSGEGIFEGMKREVTGLTTRGWNEDENRSKELQQKIAAVSRVVLLNELPEHSTSAGSAFKGSLVNTLYGASSMGKLFDTDTKQGQMLAVDEMLDAAGIDKESAINPVYKKRFEEGKESPAWVSWEHLGSLGGMMTGMGLQSAAGGAIMEGVGAGKVLANLTAQVNAGTKGARFAKAALTAIKKGAEYEITGDIFKDQSHFFNFTTGFAGGAAEGVLGGLGRLGKGAIGKARQGMAGTGGLAAVYGRGVGQKMGKIVSNAFGNKSTEAAKWIMENGKSIQENLRNGLVQRAGHGIGAGVGQFAEGNIRALQDIGGQGNVTGAIDGLVKIFQDSDVRAKYHEELDKQFGKTLSEKAGFFADMFFIGMMTGGGNKGIGHEARERAREIYSEMTAEERSFADELVKSAGELDQMHDSVLDRQGRGEDTIPTLEKDVVVQPPRPFVERPMEKIDDAINQSIQKQEQRIRELGENPSKKDVRKIRNEGLSEREKLRQENPQYKKFREEQDAAFDEYRKKREAIDPKWTDETNPEVVAMRDAYYAKEKAIADKYSIKDTVLESAREDAQFRSELEAEGKDLKAEADPINKGAKENTETAVEVEALRNTERELMDRIDKGNLSVEETADVQKQIEEVRARIAEIEGVEPVLEAETSETTIGDTETPTIEVGVEPVYVKEEGGAKTEPAEPATPPEPPVESAAPEPEKEKLPLPKVGDTVVFRQGMKGNEREVTGKVLEVLDGDKLRLEFEVGGEKTTIVIPKSKLVGDYEGVDSVEPPKADVSPAPPVEPPKTPVSEGGGIPPEPPVVEPPVIETPTETPKEKQLREENERLKQQAEADKKAAEEQKAKDKAAREKQEFDNAKGVQKTVLTLEKYNETNAKATKSALEAMDRSYRKTTHSEQYSKAMSELTGGEAKKNAKGETEYTVGDKNPLLELPELISDKQRKIGEFADVLAKRLVMTDIVGRYADVVAEMIRGESDPVKKAELLDMQSQLADQSVSLTKALADQGTIGGQGISFIGFWRNIYQHADGHISMAINKHNELLARQKEILSRKISDNLNEVKENVGREVADAVTSSMEEVSPPKGGRVKDISKREREKREKSKERLKDLLKLPDSKAMDVTTIAAELLARGGEAAIELTKIGISLAKEGAVRFVDWAKRMREEMDGMVSFEDADLEAIFKMEHDGNSPEQQAQIALEKASLEPKERQAREKTLREQVQKEFKQGDVDLHKRLMDNVGLTADEATFVMEKGKGSIEKHVEAIAQKRDKALADELRRKEAETQRKEKSAQKRAVREALNEHFGRDTVEKKLVAEGMDADTAKQVAAIARKGLWDGKTVTPEVMAREIKAVTKLTDAEIDQAVNLIMDEKGKTMFDRVKEKTGLPDDEVQAIVDNASAEFKKRAEAQVAAQVKKFKTKRSTGRAKTRPLNDVDRALETLANGNFTDADVNSVFTDRLGFIDPLTPEEVAQARKLGAELANTQAGGILEHNAARNLDRFFDQFIPREHWGKESIDTWKSMYYAGMLSGLATSVKNILSAATIVAFSPAQNMLNWAEWVRAGKAAVKAEKGKKGEVLLRMNPVTGAAVKYRAMVGGIGQARRLAGDIWAEGFMGTKFAEVGDTKLGRQMNILERRYADALRDTKGGRKAIVFFPWIYKYAGRALQAQDVFLRTIGHEMQLADAFRRENVNASKAEMKSFGFDSEKKSYAAWVNYNMSIKGHENYANAVEVAKNEVEEHQKALGSKGTPKQTARFVSVRTRELLINGFEHNGIKYEPLKVSEKGKEDAEAIAKSQIFTLQRYGVGSGVAAIVNKLKGVNAATDILMSPIVPFTTIIGNMADTIGDYNPLTGVPRSMNFSLSELISYAAGKKKDGSPRWGSAAMGDINPEKSWLGARFDMASKDQKYYEQIGRAWTGINTLITMGLLTSGNQNKGLAITWDADDDSKTDTGNEYSVLWNGKKLFSYKELPVMAAPFALVGAWHSYARNPERFGGKQGFAGRLAYAWMAMESLPMKMSIAESSLNFFDMVGKLYEAGTDPSASKGEKFFDVLVKPYLNTMSKALPQRTSFFEQFTGLFDTEKYSNKTVMESLAYFGEGAAFGALHNYVGEKVNELTGMKVPEHYKALDNFGDEIPRSALGDALPGGRFLLDLYQEDISQRPYRKFLSDRDIVLGNAQNREVPWVDDNEVLGIAYRDYTPEQWFYFKQEAGKLFKQGIEELMNDPYLSDYDKELVPYYGKPISATEKLVLQMLSRSRSAARGMVQEKFGKEPSAGQVERDDSYTGGNMYDGKSILGLIW